MILGDFFIVGFFVMERCGGSRRYDGILNIK